MRKTFLLLLPAAALLCAARPASADSKAEAISSYTSSGIEKAKAKNYKGAIRDFDRVIKIDPSNKTAYFNRGIVNMKLKNDDEAKADFEKACTLGNTGACDVVQKMKAKTETKAQAVKALVTEAEALAGSGRTDDALVKLQAAIDRKADYAPAYYARARIYVAQKKQKEALRELNTALAADKSYADAYFMRGLLFRDKNDTSKAMDDFSRDIALSPSNSRSYRERGDLLLADKSYKEALDSYYAAQERGADDVGLYYAKGVALNELGRYPQAIEALDLACARGYDKACPLGKSVSKDFAKLQAKVDEFIFEGIKAYKDGDAQKALKFYSKAVSEYPASFQARLARGNLYLEALRNDSAAVKDLTVAVEVSSGSAIAWRQRAAAYNNLEKPDLALADVERSVALESGNFDALSLRAALYAGKKDYAKAAESYEMLVQLRPQRPELHFALGNAYRAMGQKPKALANFTTACQLGLESACSWKKSMEKEAADKANAGL